MRKGVRRWLLGVRCWVLGIGCLMLAVGCDFETSGNGDLDGYWHLERVDTLASGGSCDLSQQTFFWGVQFHLLRMADLAHNDIIYRFRQEDGQLVLSAPCMFDRIEGDTLVTDLEVLRPFGVSSLDERFSIVRLDSDCLVLKSVALQLTFKKY